MVKFTNHKAIAKQLAIDFFFAKPYHSWQRGVNENLNGLVRQYFLKKTIFDIIKQGQVNRAIKKLNNRPRKRYNFLTPIEKFNEFIAENSKVAFIT